MKLLNRAIGVAIAASFAWTLAAREPVRAQITPVGGAVVDATTGAPVSLAVVSLDGTDARALTDAEGVFRLRAPSPGTYLLRVEGYGYRELSRTLVVSGPVDDLRIELEGACVRHHNARSNSAGPILTMVSV